MATLAREIPLLPGPLTLLPDNAFPAPVFRAEAAAAAAELTAEAAGETELLAGALRALQVEALAEQAELAGNRPELTDADRGVAAAGGGPADPALAEMVATLAVGDQLVHEIEALVPEQDPAPVGTPPAPRPGPPSTSPGAGDEELGGTREAPPPA